MQYLVSAIDYNEYVGRIGIGKVDNGTIRTNQDVVVVNHHDPERQAKVRISRVKKSYAVGKLIALRKRRPIG